MDRELLKDYFLSEAESLLGDFKNKYDIITNIKELQLSKRTVTRRVELLGENMNSKLMLDIKDCHAFSLQLDESNDFTDTTQLIIFIRMVFDDFNVKEELLKILPLFGRTTGKDIFFAFNDFVNKSCIPIFKLVSITTAGAFNPDSSHTVKTQEIILIS